MDGDEARFAWPAGRILVAGLLAALLGGACGSGSGLDMGSGSGVAIMPLGASITDGYNVPGGYRIELEDTLAAHGVRVDFVGSLENGPSELEDRDHEGHIGYRIDQITASVRAWLAAAEPEIVLLMIGTNDVVRDHEVTTAPSRLARLLDRIHAARPRTHVLVASIPPLANGADDRQARTYNAAIPGLVRGRAARGRPIAYVEIYEALATADLADGVHPDEGGYGKIAAVWHDALIPVLGLRE